MSRQWSMRDQMQMCSKWRMVRVWASFHYWKHTRRAMTDAIQATEAHRHYLNRKEW